MGDTLWRSCASVVRRPVRTRPLRPPYFQNQWHEARVIRNGTKPILLEFPGVGRGEVKHFFQSFNDLVELDRGF